MIGIGTMTIPMLYGNSSPRTLADSTSNGLVKSIGGPVCTA